MVVLLSRLFRKKDSNVFPEAWIIMIYEITIVGSIFNWGVILSFNLNLVVKRIKESKATPHQKFFMYSYLINVIYARNEFVGMNWKWSTDQAPVNVYCKDLWEHKYMR